MRPKFACANTGTEKSNTPRLKLRIRIVFSRRSEDDLSVVSREMCISRPPGESSSLGLYGVGNVNRSQGDSHHDVSLSRTCEPRRLEAQAEPLDLSGTTRATRLQVECLVCGERYH